METREFLQNIIDNFDLQRWKRFFSEKNSKFRPSEESFDYYNTDNFSAGLKLGELALDDGTLLFCAFKAKQKLSERSGKKAQYELGKKILKETQTDAGIFIYYNHAGSFRFSLIYANYLGKKRDWSAFRRFTYFVGSDLTNKTFKKRIGDGDFSGLEKIKDAFSVEKVTKEFYEDIANWYFWAVDHSTFPKDALAEKDGRNIAVIRLITRIIFIWFMRERGLVPKDLFEEKNITSILKSISAEDSTYYMAILQNLFFATLSTKKDERKFRSEIRGYKGYNPDFGNQNVFRFQELFKNPEKLKDYFGEIPFLNGGLFECLDDKPNGIYIDGFTSVKKNQPTVPNFLFFSEAKKADLNKAYGTKNKKYIVSGLFNILSSFNFTIDENSPDDADVALDPELLGRVFENLLASFNPETSTTARKATGSYYTPREIVDYMVTESLKAYFKTHLSAISDLNKKIVQLFSTGSEENPFDKLESKKLVELIESVRIVDPAVGSGAFPMGALNKLVFILNKVDPGNELWKQAQLSAADTIPDSRIKQDTKNRIEDFFKGKNADYGRKLYLIQKCIYGVDIQQIAVEIAKLRFFISLLVHEDIDKTKTNWGIEPLPNLDFKIMQGNSLLEEYEGIKLFDEKLIASIDFGKQELTESIKQKQSELQKEYFDLHAKNQLTKFKQAELNEELKKLDKQLKGLNKQDNKTEESAGLFDAQNEAKQKSEILKLLHKEFFETNEKETKDKIKKQIEKIGWDLIEATLKEQNKTSELKKLEQFKKSNTKPFFLWKLHFANVFENGGFDIVIANPPYIGEKGHKEIFRETKKGSLGNYYQGKMDLFYFFFHLALNLGNSHLHVAFITTNYYPTASGARKLRQDLKNRTIILKLVNFNELKIFKSATGQHNMVTILAKGQNSESIAKTCITKRTGDANPAILESIVSWQDDKSDYFEASQKDIYDNDEYYIRFAGNSTTLVNPIQIVLEKIKNQSKDLISLCNINCGIQTGCDEMIIGGTKQGVFILSDDEIKTFNNEERKLIKPFFNTSDIYKYFVNLKNYSWVIYTDRNIDTLSKYINLYKHFNKKEYRKVLDNIREVKNGRIKYFQLQWPRNDEIFKSEKIVCSQRSNLNDFGYSTEKWYGGSGIFFITKKDETILLKYILALINSKLYYLWLYYRGKRKGESLELIVKPLSKIPIKKISKPDQKPFIEIVDKIMAITKSGDYLENPAKKEEVKEFEKQIDQMVYKLYGLTPEEIKIVESSAK